MQSEKNCISSLGFSSSLVLKFEEDPSRALKPCSKLLSITKNSPGKNFKHIMMPVFYRKQFSPASCSFSQGVINQGKSNFEKKTGKKVTATTFGSLHTLSQLEAENQEFFNEKENFSYENDLKGSLHEGNFVAFCRKCGKETVCVDRGEKGKSWIDWIFCCCSNWNLRGKTWICPICMEVLIKTN
jgi:hypothetical protein